MKKLLILLIVPLCFFGLIKKVKAASGNYGIKFYYTYCLVPLNGNVYDYLPEAYVYDTRTGEIVTDDGMMYTYNYMGIKFENINTSVPGQHIGFIHASHSSYDIPTVMQKIDVYVYDDIPPTVSINSVISKSYKDNLNILNCVSYSDNISSVCTVEIYGDYDEHKVGEYPLTVCVIDEGGNSTEKDFTLKVYDDISPIIECRDTIKINVNSVFNKNDYIRVYDEYDGDLSYTMPDVDTTTLHEEYHTIYAVDSSNNSTSKSVTFKIVDEVKPTIILKEDEITINEEYNLFDNIKEVSDNYDTLEINKVLISKKRIGTQQFQIIYELIDSSNNYTKVSCIANIDYNNKPVIEAIHLDDLQDNFDPLYYVNCYDVEDGNLNNKVMVVEMNYEELYCIYEVYDSDNNLTRKRIDFMDSNLKDKYEKNNSITFPKDEDVNYNPVDNNIESRSINEYKKTNYNFIYYIILGVFVLGIIIFILVKHFRKKMV